MEACYSVVEQPSMQPYCINQHFTELVSFDLITDADDMCSVSNFIEPEIDASAWLTGFSL